MHFATAKAAMTPANGGEVEKLLCGNILTVARQCEVDALLSAATSAPRPWGICNKSSISFLLTRAPVRQAMALINTKTYDWYSLEEDSLCRKFAVREPLWKIEILCLTNQIAAFTNAVL